MQLTWWLWLWYPLMVWWWWMRGERCLYAHSWGCWKLSAPYLTVLPIGWWDVPSTGLLVAQGREPERGRGLLQWTYSFLWCLLLGRKVMTNLDSILKSSDMTLPTKVCLVKAMVFPVVMCECESWTVKKAEHWKIDAFEMWCWRRLLRVPWTARRSNQSIQRRSVLGVHW